MAQRKESFPDDNWFHAILQLGTDTNRVLMVRDSQHVYDRLAVAQLDLHRAVTAGDLEKFIDTLEKNA